MLTLASSHVQLFGGALWDLEYLCAVLSRTCLSRLRCGHDFHSVSHHSWKLLHDMQHQMKHLEKYIWSGWFPFKIEMFHSGSGTKLQPGYTRIQKWKSLVVWSYGLKKFLTSENEFLDSTIPWPPWGCLEMYGASVNRWSHQPPWWAKDGICFKRLIVF